MALRSFIRALLLFSSLAPAVPTAELSERQNPDRIPDSELDAAKDTYQGIWWDTAADTCTTDQFRILVESLRMAMEMGKYDENIADTDGWAWSFMQSFRWTDDNAATYNAIHSNLKQLSQFPFNGVSNERKRRKKAYQIQFYCGDIPNYFSCANSNTAAYTVGPGGIEDVDAGGQTKLENCPYCHAMGYCPNFFDRLQYVNDKAKQDYQPSDINALVTREHTMLHELLHADLIGTCEHITDEKAYLRDGTGQVAERTVYGANLCHQYARLHKQGGPESDEPDHSSDVNPRTANNADSYAWMFTYNWFASARHWGTGSVPNIAPRVEGDGVLTELGPGESFNESIPDPENCLDPASCSYLGGSFYSDGGCLLSASCRYPLDDGKVDPECTCTCDGSETALTDAKCNGGAVQPGFEVGAPDPDDEEPGLQCNGQSGPDGFMGREEMDIAARNFCYDTNSPTEFNDDRVTITREYLYGYDNIEPRDYCYRALLGIIDGCDTAGKTKFGGVFVSEDPPIKYTITPHLSTHNYCYSSSSSSNPRSAFVGRDDLANAVEEFCNAGPSTKKFNEGSINEFDITRLDTGSGPFTTETCVNGLNDLIDRCSIGTDEHDWNQFNFKYGGEFYDGNMELSITPTQGRSPDTISGASDGETPSTKNRCRGSTGKNGKQIDKAVLQQCLAGYGDMNTFNTLNCADTVDFYFNVLNWNSPKDCWSRCVKFLSAAIEDGASATYCDTTVTFASCFIGYKPTPGRVGLCGEGNENW